jgi:hypothetical protein
LIVGLTVLFEFVRTRGEDHRTIIPDGISFTPDIFPVIGKAPHYFPQPESPGTTAPQYLFIRRDGSVTAPFFRTSDSCPNLDDRVAADGQIPHDFAQFRPTWQRHWRAQFPQLFEVEALNR